MGKECPAYKLIAAYEPFPDMQSTMNICGGRSWMALTSLTCVNSLELSTELSEICCSPCAWESSKTRLPIVQRVHTFQVHTFQ